MWKTYLKEKIISERKEIEKLIEIDNKENGTNYSYDYILEFVDKDINFHINNKNIIIEGNFFILINLINSCSNINIIISTLDDYGLNSYIIKKYEEYINDYKINKNIFIEIKEHFRLEDENIIVIGSKAFITEMKKIYLDSKYIEFEL